MGAWGTSFHENDDAADWLADFGDAPGWSTVDEALACGDDYLEAPECSNALAAAEVVAAGIGKPSPHLDAAIAEWASRAPDEAEQRHAKAAEVVTRIRDDSELSELWQEADEYPDWQQAVNETLSRL